MRTSSVCRCAPALRCGAGCARGPGHRRAGRGPHRGRGSRWLRCILSKPCSRRATDRRTSAPQADGASAVRISADGVDSSANRRRNAHCAPTGEPARLFPKPVKAIGNSRGIGAWRNFRIAGAVSFARAEEPDARGTRAVSPQAISQRKRNELRPHHRLAPAACSARYLRTGLVRKDPRASQGRTERSHSHRQRPCQRRHRIEAQRVVSAALPAFRGSGRRDPRAGEG